MSEQTELIKERLDIAEIVSEYVALKRAGRHFKGLCPFHQEKTPSFVVSPDKGIWHCFGCSRGGDIFSFVQEVEGLEFPEALKLLAERAGVELASRSRQGAGVPDRRQRLFELLSLTARFYQEVLLRHEGGKKAKQYLQQRAVKIETMEQFQLGYAPKRWDSLQQFLRKHGFRPDEMIAAGVVGSGQRGKLYDRFRGRIIFPIADVQGRVVALGGRIVPWHETGEEGKYVNSPETELYEKRKVVYNLSRAKEALRAGKPCLVVEGYMDAVMLMQSGVEGVVASSGTAFTEEHISQLTRFTDTLHFAFDADSAGWRASLAATRAALAAGMNVSVVMLPPGKDPADVAAEDSQAVRDLVHRPRSLVAVLLEKLRAADGRATRQQQLEAVLPFVGRVTNPVLQGEMIQEIAAAVHIPEPHVVLAVQRLAQQTGAAGEFAVSKDESEKEVGGGARFYPEYQLLGVLMTDAAARQAVFPQLSTELFLDQSARNLYNELQRLTDEDNNSLTMVSDELLARFSDEQLPLAEGARALGMELLEYSSRTAEEEARDLFRLVRRRLLESQLAAAQEKFAAADDSRRLENLKHIQLLVEELANVKSNL